MLYLLFAFDFILAVEEAEDRQVREGMGRDTKTITNQEIQVASVDRA